MKVITNKTRRPIKVSLPGGKFLHLGPARTGQIADRAADLPSVKKLVEAGDVEIVAEGSTTPTGGGKSSAGHSSSHGHAQSSVIRPKGDR